MLLVLDGLTGILTDSLAIGSRPVILACDQANGVVYAASDDGLIRLIDDYSVEVFDSITCGVHPVSIDFDGPAQGLRRQLDRYGDTAQISISTTANYRPLPAVNAWDDASIAGESGGRSL